MVDPTNGINLPQDVSFAAKQKDKSCQTKTEGTSSFGEVMRDKILEADHVFSMTKAKEIAENARTLLENDDAVTLGFDVSKLNTDT